MELTARQVSALSFLALVPVAVYGALSGKFTLLIGALTVLCVLLIAGSLLLMFGPAPGETEASVSH
jgi:uncharacterized membrane protein YkgB